MFSVIIGVAALVATLAIGKGATLMLQAQIDSLGRDTIYVFGGSRSRGGVRGGMKTNVLLRLPDWRAVKLLPTLELVAPCVWGEVQLVYGSSNWGCDFTGTSPDYLTIMGSKIARGRTFTPDEVQGGAAVVVLGHNVANKLFGVEEPVGKTIRMGQFPFLVIGVMEEKGIETWRSDDGIALLPFSTAQRRLKNTTDFDCLLCKARRSDQLSSVSEQIAQTLRNLNGIKPDDKDAYYAPSSEKWMKSRVETGKTFTSFTLMTALVNSFSGMRKAMPFGESDFAMLAPSFLGTMSVSGPGMNASVKCSAKGERTA
jgi:putative ABC transport system permease protein